ncbi:hypothetical protein QCA50_015258 [Cerrena zonata]|uniref:Uncharacterized protein n=1 Tax=Cerrena zonata TaxID=2478898 RepID=A0AAW0FW06_9APHY
MSQPVAGTSAELSAYLFFNIAAGHVALPVLAATLLFSTTARQHFTMINLCFAWIITGVSGTLLFYVGKHTGPEPGSSICLAQASLMDSLPMLTSMVTLSLVFNLWKTIITDEELFIRTRKVIIYNLGLLFAPYIMFTIFIAITVVLGRKHGDDVTRESQFFYCSLNWEPLTLAISILSTLVSIVTLGIEAHFIFWLRRHWGAICKSGFIEEIDLHLYSRIGIFTLYQATSIVLNLVSLEHNLGVLPQMFSASVGLVLFLLIASHPVIIHTWSFRRSANKQSLPWYGHSQPEEPTIRIRHASEATADTGTSTTLTMKDYYERKLGPNGHGVTVIGRPEEAFARPPGKQRSTISTWGF